MVGFEGAAAGCQHEAAIGGIFGVYGQALTERGPPMALPQSALSELLEAFRAGDGVDLIRDPVRVALLFISPQEPGSNDPTAPQSASPSDITEVD